MLLEIAFQKLHQRVAVYNTGGRTLENARLGADVRFTPFAFFAGYEVRRDADGRGEGVDLFQRLHLRRVLSDDPFAAVHVRNMVLSAEIIHHFFPTETQARLERRLAIVKASMDYLEEEM